MLKKEVVFTMKLLYFSSTGNCIFIAESLGGEMLSIPGLLKDNEFETEDDAVGIIFLTYYAGLPSIVEDYLNQVKISSNYVFTICSYESESFGAEKTLKKSNKILEEKSAKYEDGNVIGDKCEFCLACVHHCKQRVIRTNIQKSDDSFRNHHIELSIVESNNIG